MPVTRPSPQVVVPPALSLPSAEIRVDDEVALLRCRLIELENRQGLGLNLSPEEFTEDRPRQLLGNQTSSHPRKHEGRVRTLSKEAVADDAASVLEFLAWGRRKNSELPVIVSPESIVASSSQGDYENMRADSDITAADVRTLDDCSQLTVLQLLLPDRHLVEHMVLWHEKNLLWYHCSYFAPTLNLQLQRFYDDYHGLIEHPNVDLQWVALLFSVIIGSIVCCPDSVNDDWGFGEEERNTLSRRWFEAAISCLSRADFASHHSINSVQTVATLTLSAHILGFSDLHSTYLAAIIRIAQSLGLHRLDASANGNLVQNEAGRRVWLQLCTQDWFSVPFSDTYLINPLYSKSDLPLNCHDQSLDSLPDTIPTVAGYSRFLGSIAIIIPRLQDNLLACNTLFTKYEQVMKWDEKLRRTAMTERPEYLSPVPIHPDWPLFVPWARRALAISSSHKIIMIHRSFLSKSFSNPAFAFTRQTCLAASRTIIHEYKCVMQEDGPVLWTHQAFAVAACIILVLDELHRQSHDSDSVKHTQLVYDTIEILKTCRNSMIAVRGVKIVSALLDKINVSSRAHDERQKRKLDNDHVVDCLPTKRPRDIHGSASMESSCEAPVTQVPSLTRVQIPERSLAVSEDLNFEFTAWDDINIEQFLGLAGQDFLC